MPTNPPRSRDRSRKTLRRIAGLLFLLLAVSGGPGESAASAPERESVPMGLAKIHAEDGAQSDRFGIAVAVDGDTAIVGASHDYFSVGAAYIFRAAPADDGAWRQVTKLTADDGDFSDRFGAEVDISGGTAVVAADFASVYVFERESGDPDVWSQVAQLSVDEPGAALDSISLQGDRLVSGAPGADVVGNNSGSVYVFQRDAGAEEPWVEVARVLPDDGAELDAFGSSVAFDGRFLIVGAPGDDDLAPLSGAAYIFERQPGTEAWTQVAKLYATDGGTDDQFGDVVSISGEVALVSSWRNDDLGDESGSVYVFRRDAGGTGVWGEVAKLLPDDGVAGDRFGKAVELDGPTAVIGAPGVDAWGDYSGAAYVFERGTGGPGAWGQVAKVVPADGARRDEFGDAVAMSWPSVFFGAAEDDDLGRESGSAYVASLDDCVLELELAPTAVPAGEELRVRLYLAHNRPRTVTVPFLLWIEDDAGAIVAETRTEPMTLHWGQVVRRDDLTVAIPQAVAPGRYRVLVGIERMGQGVAAASAVFQVSP